ncbi:MAG: hypothetical protein ACWGSQ_03870 [Longimicrobiales bacterium]
MLALGSLSLLPVLVPGSSFAAAQDAVELWGAWGEWSGKNAESFKGGYALGAGYLADVGLPVDLGIDVLFARMDADQLTKVVDEFQASAVLRRWILGGGSLLRPYLGARVGYTRLSADYEDLKFEQNGVFAGPVLGIVLPSGKTLSPTLSLEALRVRYSDTSLFLEDLEVPQSGGYGWRFFVRLGVTFGSGWERRGR